MKTKDLKTGIFYLYNNRPSSTWPLGQGGVFVLDTQNTYRSERLAARVGYDGPAFKRLSKGQKAGYRERSGILVIHIDTSGEIPATVWRRLAKVTLDEITANQMRLPGEVRDTLGDFGPYAKVEVVNPRFIVGPYEESVAENLRQEQREREAARAAQQVADAERKRMEAAVRILNHFLNEPVRGTFSQSRFGFKRRTAELDLEQMETLAELVRHVMPKVAEAQDG